MPGSHTVIYDGVDVKSWWVDMQAADAQYAFQHGLGVRPIVTASIASAYAHDDRAYLFDYGDEWIEFRKTVGAGGNSTFIVTAARPGAPKFG